MFNLLQDRVSANADGTVTISSETRADGTLKTWRETAPFHWQEVGGQDRFGAILEDGRIVAIRRSGDPSTGMVRVPAWMSSGWIFPALGAAVVILVLTALARPAMAIVRRNLGVPPPARADVRGGRLAWLAAVVAAGFALGWALLLRRIAGGDPGVYMGEFDPWIRFLHLLGLATMVGAGIAAWNAWHTVRSRRGWGTKLWSVLLVGACGFVVWFAFAFRLITLGLDY